MRPVKWSFPLQNMLSWFHCRVIFRRKTETQSCASRSKPWMATTASPYAIQGPYAFSDVTKLDSSMPADIMTKHPCVPSQDSQCDDYENVSCADRESCFVTNDIYETSKAQSRRCHSQTGWVENEIYGWHCWCPSVPKNTAQLVRGTRCSPSLPSCTPDCLAVWCITNGYVLCRPGCKSFEHGSISLCISSAAHRESSIQSCKSDEWLKRGFICDSIFPEPDQ